MQAIPEPLALDTAPDRPQLFRTAAPEIIDGGNAIIGQPPADAAPDPRQVIEFQIV